MLEFVELEGVEKNIENIEQAKDKNLLC